MSENDWKKQLNEVKSEFPERKQPKKVFKTRKNIINSEITEETRLKGGHIRRR